MKKILIIASIMFSLLLLSCGSKSTDSNAGKSSDKISNKSDSSKPMQGRKSKAGEGRGGRFQRMAQATAVPVEVTYLTTGNISSYLMYSSVLETEQTVDVFSRIAGLVEKLYVEEGMHVKQNQPLLFGRAVPASWRAPGRWPLRPAGVAWDGLCGGAGSRRRTEYRRSWGREG